MNIANALVVDDSKTARLTLKRQLEKRSVEVGLAESGEDAIEYLKNNLPEVIFMDIMMPGMDGFETTQAITSQASLAHIPVIMCTSKDDEKSRNKAKEAGAKGFAVKPISGNELAKALELANEIKNTGSNTAKEAVVATPTESTPTPSTTPPSATTVNNAEITKLATDIANKVAEEVATKKANEIAYKIAEDAASEAAGKIAFETAEPQARTIAERIATEVAEEKVRSVIEKVAQDVAGEKVKEIIEKSAESIITQLIEKQSKSAANDFESKLQQATTDYLSSNNTTKEIDRQIQKSLPGPDIVRIDRLIALS